MTTEKYIRNSSTWGLAKIIAGLEGHKIMVAKPHRLAGECDIQFNGTECLRRNCLKCYEEWLEQPFEAIWKADTEDVYSDTSDKPKFMYNGDSFRLDAHGHTVEVKKHGGLFYDGENIIK